MKMSALKALIRLMRLPHWGKNLLIFSPLFFAGRFFDLISLWETWVGFLLFSLGASGIYILNDVHDVEKDKFHPVKSKRPLASGLLSRRFALFFAIILIVSSGAVGLMVNLRFGVILLVYVSISEIYSWKLKFVAPLDVFCIAFGYLLRVLAGGAISCVDVSSWLFIASFLVTLFIALAKRLGEIVQNNDVSYRATLSEYSHGYLLAATSLTGSAAVVTFSLYTIGKDPKLVYAIVPATYGLLRYLLAVVKGAGSEPLRIFSKDRQLQIASLIFMGIIIAVIYW